jgi:hypothetical protein
MRTRNPRSAALRRRSGLAPLELVLVLPMFMMILALMIIVGTAGSWKVRTLANSRQAVFRAVYPRTTDNDVNPQNWPAPATMSVRGASLSPFDRDPFALHYVVRGPVISDPNTGRMLYVKDLTLDMTRGLESGYAEIDRELPLWSQLPYRNHYVRDTQVFAGEQWQHGTMGIPNHHRRILITYEFDLARASGGQVGPMMQAVNDLLSNPDRPVLFTLDRDDELVAFRGAYVPYDPRSQYFPYRASAYPPVEVGCDFNLRSRVRRLVGNPLDPTNPGEIDLVPCRLARLFRNMYQQQLNALPPNDPGRAVLQQKIQQLDDFINSLGYCR